MRVWSRLVKRTGQQSAWISLVVPVPRTLKFWFAHHICVVYRSAPHARHSRNGWKKYWIQIYTINQHKMNNCCRYGNGYWQRGRRLPFVNVPIMMLFEEKKNLAKITEMEVSSAKIGKKQRMTVQLLSNYSYTFAQRSQSFSWTQPKDTKFNQQVSQTDRFILSKQNFNFIEIKMNNFHRSQWNRKFENSANKKQKCFFFQFHFTEPTRGV